MRIPVIVLLTGLWVLPLLAADEAKKPPEGWKEHQAKGNSFSCWLPTEEGILRENNKDKTPKKGVTLRFASVTFQPKNGPLFEAGTATVTPYAGDFTKLKATERIDILHDLVVEASKGKASDEVEVKQGRVPGRDFIIEADKTFTKHRMYQYVDRFFYLSVTGTKEQINSKAAATFLEGYKIPDRYTGLGEKDKDK